MIDTDKQTETLMETVQEALSHPIKLAPLPMNEVIGLRMPERIYDNALAALSALAARLDTAERERNEARAGLAICHEKWQFENQRAVAAERAGGDEPAETEYAWLVERGQPEGQEPTVWARGPQAADDLSWTAWTQDANEARRFTSRDDAEAFIDARLLEPHAPYARTARAVEHGWFQAGGGGQADG